MKTITLILLSSMFISCFKQEQPIPEEPVKREQHEFTFDTKEENINFSIQTSSDENREQLIRRLREQYPDLIIHYPGVRVISEDKEFEERAEEWAEENFDELEDKYGN